MKSKLNIQDRFGRLVVLQKTNQKRGKRFLWICLCDCGTEIKVTSDQLRTNGTGTASCGCLLREKITAKGRGLIDITGQKFGRLTVISKSDSYNNKKVLWLCRCECGNEKLLRQNTLASGLVQSCGCLKKESVYLITGVNHYNWKGGVTPEKEKIRNSQAYILWRKAIFERDDYTCQCCYSKGKQLNAHHLYDFNTREDLRLDSNNGLSLCVSCHREFHKQFGKGGNTPEQFKEFKDERRHVEAAG